MASRLSWNTFWARGACSGCGVKWPSTQCFDCNQYSPDEAWYHYREPSESVKAETADTKNRLEFFQKAATCSTGSRVSIGMSSTSKTIAGFLAAMLAWRMFGLFVLASSSTQHTLREDARERLEAAVKFVRGQEASTGACKLQVVAEIDGQSHCRRFPASLGLRLLAS